MREGDAGGGGGPGAERLADGGGHRGTPPLEQIALEDLESEVQALLHDEELQGQLLEMLGDLLEDGVSGLGEAEEEEEVDVDLLDVAELSLPPQPTDGAAAGADRGGFPTGGKDVGDLRDLDE